MCVKNGALKKRGYGKYTDKNGELLKDICLFLTDATSRRYFSGVDIAEGAVLFSQRETVYFTDARYNFAAAEKLKSSGVKSVLLKEGAAAEYIKNGGYKFVGLNYGKVTLKEYEEYFSYGKIFDCSEFLSKKRAAKSEKEIALIKKACEITQKAFYEVIKQIKEGMTERELKEKLVSLYIKYGAEKESFDTIVAFGKNSAVPHHQTGDTVLNKNSAILIDTGCVYGGYCSDFTRTLFFGEPDGEFLKTYSAVKKANDLAEEYIKSGVSASEADAVSRNYLKEEGLGEYFTHSLGHGVGLEIHESPYLSPKSNDLLSENFTFTVEPGIYFNGKFGVRIEDTAVIENGVLKRLFTDGKDLIIIK